MLSEASFSNFMRVAHGSEVCEWNFSTTNIAPNHGVADDFKEHWGHSSMARCRKMAVIDAWVIAAVRRSLAISQGKKGFLPGEPEMC